MDARTSTHGLLEAMEEGENQVQESETSRSQREGREENGEYEERRLAHFQRIRNNPGKATRSLLLIRRKSRQSG